MSYELHFEYQYLPKKSDFQSYFSKIEHIVMEGSHVLYHNPGTGVYFTLDVDVTNDERISNAHLFVNYMRPSAFALEIEPLVTAFQAAFPSELHDPQMEGMGSGPYSPEGFLRGWNAGNAFGYKVLCQERVDFSPFVILSRAEVHAMWRWNFDLPRQIAKGRDQFLPTIFAMRVQASRGTAVIWGNAVAARLPKVDLVLCGHANPDVVLSVLTWDQLRAILTEHGFEESDWGFDLRYSAPPSRLLAALKELPPLKPHGDIERFNFDKVLDAEMLPEQRG